MKWADLSNNAKSILEWVEHVWTGQKQNIEIHKNMMWRQPLKYVGDVNVFVTEELFDEIKTWLPHSKATVYSIDGDMIRVRLRDEIKLH
ncbi:MULTISPECIES: hypothetical protein [unclassified Paenibacillus]|uniref:hypothetical protein n=1 Tax=unclassified Paenibacillus TaxID=185978 RepID=UPI00034E3463|nr:MULTISPECIES: hypothetical protein [unclassified Paenibacillus]EPD81317.1 hypothetical protein HMPREF1207_05074 [Paenibacillus sp. HGH0039]